MHVRVSDWDVVGGRVMGKFGARREVEFKDDGDIELT